MPHLVIVRTSASLLDLKRYNCQELGLAKALTHKGIKVSLIMAGKEDMEEEYPCEGGYVSVSYLRCKGIDQRFAFFIGIEKKLDELAPDAVQVHEVGIFMTWYVTRWAKRHAVPCYLIQGTYQMSPKIGVRQIETLYCQTFGRNTLKNVAGIGCKTEMAAQFIRTMQDGETALTRIGLDESKFANPENIDWRKEYRLEDKHVLLYVGTMEKRRNPHFLLDVMKSLPDDYALLMVGQGPVWEALRQRIEAEGLQGKVFLLGRLRQEQLPSLYKNSDLFLLASDYEILGMVLLESMYFGLPAIASCTAGSQTVIAQEVDGVIIHEGNVGEWKLAIMTVCADPERLGRMKDRASRKIRNEWVWDKAVDSFMKLYGWVS